jgi:hypothetical protein
MFRRSMLSVAIVAAIPLGTCLLLLTPAQARADHDRRERREWNDRGHDRRPELRRLVWQYQGGFFKDAGNGQWVESNATGTYYFREVGRNREFVDLFDASRGFAARLYDNAMYLKQGNNDPVFSKFYDGRWTE